MTCIMTFWIFLNINTNLDIRVKSSAVSVWDFIFVSEVIPQTSSPWLCVLVHPLLKSSSSTVFMELCFVVSVVSLLSQRPCKESHHGAAQPHCAPTTIPELTHLSSSNMSELQIYVRNPTGHEEDCVCLTLGLFSGSKKSCFSFVVQFIFIQSFCYKPPEGEFRQIWVRLEHRIYNSVTHRFPHPL